MNLLIGIPDTSSFNFPITFCLIYLNMGVLWIFTIIILYNVCAVGGYLEYHREISLEPWAIQYRGGNHPLSFEYRGGYHDTCGGYHKYCGGVQYHGVLKYKRFSPTVLSIPMVPHVHHNIPHGTEYPPR